MRYLAVRLHPHRGRANLRAMNKTLIGSTFAVVSVLGAGTALAGGSQGTIGVGAEATLSGLGGMSFSYDAGSFHAGGFLSFRDEGQEDDTDIGLGGRFFWHIHSTPVSDFSIGGNLGMQFVDTGPNQSDSLLYLEPAIQLRAFIAGNVAISATAGISIGLSDASGVDLTGQPTGAAGIHYYFF